jgi:hypothetical protein
LDTHRQPEHQLDGDADVFRHADLDGDCDLKRYFDGDRHGHRDRYRHLYGHADGNALVSSAFDF